MRRRSPYSKQDLPLKCKGRGWKRRSCFLFLVLWCAIFFLGARSASAQENLFPRADGDRARYDVQIDFEKAYLSGVCLMLQEGGIIKASVVNEFGASALDFSYDLEKKKVTEGYESTYTSLYDYLTETVKDVPPGSNGVIFTPWLHGNRCPFEDPNAGGMFFNINIDTGKSEMLRSVIEGVCFHQRWMLEAEAKKIKTSDVIRFVGGGALSRVTCQILADVTGRTVETVNRPQDVGAVGAAAIMGIGLGVIENIGKVKDYVPAVKTYKPNAANKAVYDKNFEVFKTLYKNNKDAFKALNG